MLVLINFSRKFMTLGKEPVMPMRANTSKLENVTFGVYSGLPKEARQS